MIIPPERLAPDTLTSLIESYVNREGTDYGDVEFSLADKVEQVKAQLSQKHVFIVYDPDLESINILTKEACGEMGLL